jgi:hypothetical protein
VLLKNVVADVVVMQTVFAVKLSKRYKQLPRKQLKRLARRSSE